MYRLSAIEYELQNIKAAPRRAPPPYVPAAPAAVPPLSLPETAVLVSNGPAEEPPPFPDHPIKPSTQLPQHLKQKTVAAEGYNSAAADKEQHKQEAATTDARVLPACVHNSIAKFVGSESAGVSISEIVQFVKHLPASDPIKHGDIDNSLSRLCKRHGVIRKVIAGMSELESNSVGNVTKYFLAPAAEPAEMMASIAVNSRHSHKKCKFYAKAGRCKSGSSCLFEHDAAPMERNNATAEQVLAQATAAVIEISTVGAAGESHFNGESAESSSMIAEAVCQPRQHLIADACCDDLKLCVCVSLIAYACRHEAGHPTGQ